LDILRSNFHNRPDCFPADFQIYNKKKQINRRIDCACANHKFNNRVDIFGGCVFAVSRVGVYWLAVAKRKPMVDVGVVDCVVCLVRDK
jgi:hypothetical protein